MTVRAPFPLRLGDVARELEGARIVGDANVLVHGLHHDSRKVDKGDLFVARKGASHDGAAFVRDAIARGASAIMVSEGTAIDAKGLSVIYVHDATIGMARAASAVYGHPSFGLDVIGITGTNGKTTTTHLVRAAVDGSAGRLACGVVGTVGYKYADLDEEPTHTTPESDELARVMLAMRQKGATHVAMEVSSIAIELGRVSAVRFACAALTNFTQDHLDFHGTMEAYAAAKKKLFFDLAPGSCVLNVDDALGRSLAKEVRAPVVLTSANKNASADVLPIESKLDARGIEAKMRTPQGDVMIQSPLIGAHNLENLATALGIACALGLDVGRAAEALSREKGAPGRLERCDERGDDITVLVDYAHTPDALARVLDALRAVAEARIVCVFGCGGDRDPTKREMMGRAVGERADVAIVTSDNPRTEDPITIARAAANGVRAAGLEPIVEIDRKSAIERAITSAKAKDVVLVAGKGHEHYQIIGTEKYPFDDRVECKAALGKRRG
jgi:UDP-N-acetylmuramoyl-L-alanyl-D-glutamate--2,6-diaminopimelate ligase